MGERIKRAQQHLPGTRKGTISAPQPDSTSGIDLASASDTTPISKAADGTRNRSVGKPANPAVPQQANPRRTTKEQPT